MTYIEFFDKIASKNISACLTCVPDRVIYIGYNSKLMKKHISNYEKVFSNRGYNIEFLLKTVSKSNLDNGVELLSEIVETYDDCVFDVTGGEEMLTLALGIVYSKYPNKNIQIHKFNIKNNIIYDYDKDGTTIYKNAPQLSIDENIKIFGGAVAYGDIDDKKTTYKWDLTPDFLKDINLIWDISKDDVRYWNKQISVFEDAETVGTQSEDELTTIISRDVLKQNLDRRKAKHEFSNKIIKHLLKHGLLTRFDENETTITISYKNKQVKKCLTKAGQALEMKIYTIVRDILDEGGTSVYNDALNGVVIDWDGELHGESVEEIYDTQNEIDIMLMHGIVPVFISCKNGNVFPEELYKLNTVADRFGGHYSKKVLVATSIFDSGIRGKYIRSRAKDMNIKLIEGVQDLDDTELKKKFKNIWNN